METDLVQYPPDRFCEFSSDGVRSWRTSLVVALVLVACTDTVAPVEPLIVDVAAEPGVGLSWVLDVQLDRPGPVAVTYGRADGSTLEVRADSMSLAHRIVLTRLHPESPYIATVEAGRSSRSKAFDTPGLPAPLAAIEFTATGEPTSPLALLELSQPEGFNGYVVVDGAGEVVWYHETVGAPTGATRRANGNFVVLDLGIGLVEVAPDGREVSVLPHPPDGSAHHDVIETAAGAVLFLSFDSRVVDGMEIVGDAIREWEPETGRVTKVWSAFDHLSATEDWGVRSATTDWLHSNSLFLGPRGNVVVSFQRLNQIASIPPGFDGFEWRLGGPNATVTIPESDPISGQHTAAEVASGRVLMFDNGLERDQPFSRAVEFDVSGTEAVKVWEFRPQPDNWSRAVSSARRLANGHTLVGFGLSEGIARSTGPVEVYEVDAAGTVVWHLLIGGALQFMYRATPLSAVGWEEVVG